MLTIAFNHKRFNNIVSDHFKVGMTNPMADGSLGAGKEVVENCNFMTEKHQSVNKMGANEASTTGDQDAFTLRRSKQFDRGETRKSGV
ncbi:hypothetical protein CVT25_003458 [Psilocybe cyanescens]|uniref:Uncharacterized protein n=1 Tax=Psilocybe cyanescens TaxID=93625 RepID=A0A409WM35_PSICY|nr:hypothetical protein CVT25_003458 [Psilocybe cyanescens]